MSYPRRDTAKNGSGVVSIGAASATLIAANADRLSAYITNDHATQVVYLGFGVAAVVSQGVRVNPAGGSVYINDFTGAINAIATGASTPVTFVEL